MHVIPHLSLASFQLGFDSVTMKQFDSYLQGKSPYVYFQIHCLALPHAISVRHREVCMDLHHSAYELPSNTAD